LLFLTQDYSGDQINNEMGESRGTYGEEERFIQVFGCKTRGKETIWKKKA